MAVKLILDTDSARSFGKSNAAMQTCDLSLRKRVRIAVGGGPCQDVDDVGTLCMLNALADAGEVMLLPPGNHGQLHAQRMHGCRLRAAALLWP